MSLTFEWDSRKAALNRRKHRVAFDEAVTAFGDPMGRIESDPRHSVGEDRLVLLGTAAGGNVYGPRRLTHSCDQRPACYAPRARRL